MANFYGRSRAYVPFQVCLTPELNEQLMKQSFETGQSQVAIVNAALEYYLDHVAPGIPQSTLPKLEGDDQ